MTGCMPDNNICTGLNKIAQSKLTNPWLMNSDMCMEMRSYEMFMTHNTNEMLVNHTDNFIQMNICNRMNADNWNTNEWS